MAQEGINAQHLFSAIQPIFGKNMQVGSVVTESGTESIRLSSRQSHDYDAVFSLRGGWRKAL